MIDFDPWTATLEEAEKQPITGNSRDAIYQCVAAHELTEKKEMIINGDGFAVLQAVAQCALHGLAMPDWLTDAYLKRYRAVQQCKVDSWDAVEAFGQPYPQAKQLTTLRLQRLYGLQLAILFTDDDFHSRKRLPRTLEGREAAARILGITEKQVRTLLPKTRSNVKGHKPYGWRSPTAARANDPFSLTGRKTPKK